MNTREFAEQHVVTIAFRPMARNLNMLDPAWVARHYTVTLRHQGRSLTTSFSKGMGLPHGVEVEEVLDSLASDAAGIENASSFEDWASDLGFTAAPPAGVRSRQSAASYGAADEWDAYQRAKKTYAATERNTAALKRLLGPGLFQTLVFDTERL